MPVRLFDAAELIAAAWGRGIWRLASAAAGVAAGSLLHPFGTVFNVRACISLCLLLGERTAFDGLTTGIQ